LNEFSAFDHDRFLPGGQHRPSPFAAIPWRAKLMTLALMSSDFLAVVTAYFLSRMVWLSPWLDGIRLRPVEDLIYDNASPFLLLGGGMGLILLLSFGWLGMYKRGVSILNVEEDVMLIKGLALNITISMAMSFLMRDLPMPRIALILSAIIMAPLIIIGRRFIRAFGNWLLSAGVGAQPVIIYGAGETGRQLASRIMSNSQLGLTPVGFIDNHADEMEGWVNFGPGNKYRLPVLGAFSQFVSSAESTGAKYLFISIPRLRTGHLLEVQALCRKVGVACFYVPHFSLGPFRRWGLTFIADVPLAYEKVVTTQLSHHLIKRTSDACLSIAALILLGPLMLLIAGLIKIFSPGPVIFQQDRIGRYGRTFRIYKFRTMDVKAPVYADKPSPGSPQVFTLGRILRKTSLDELPQLWNVLKGDMSLVGPRPDMPYIVEQYSPSQRERLLALPGMTGLWQVSADRNHPIHENIDYDLYYIYNQSLLLDFVILFRTIFCLFSGH